jgi:hypothetical protein
MLLLLLQTTININGNEVGMYHYAHKGVDWVFVDHPCYPRPGGIYADEHGVYGDNQVRLQQQQLQQFSLGFEAAAATGTAAETPAPTWHVSRQQQLLLQQQ